MNINIDTCMFKYVYTYVYTCVYMCAFNKFVYMCSMLLDAYASKILYVPYLDTHCIRKK